MRSRPSFVLSIHLCLAVWSFAQVDTGIWVPTENSVHHLDRDGALVNSYPSPCTGAFLPCQYAVARDGLGNVYIGQFVTQFPGVSGSLRQFRSGAGLVKTWPSTASDVICDRNNNVWFASPSTGPSLVVSHTVVYRATPGLGFTNGSVIIHHISADLAAHPVDGIWVAAGDTVRRISSSMVEGPSLVFPTGFLEIASDRQGRLWVYNGAGGIDRVVEAANGTLSVDLSIPISNVESMHVDLCGILHVHQQGGTSSMVRITSDGIVLPAVQYGLRFKAANLGTGGEYWFLYSGSGSGLYLLSSGSGSGFAQFLEPASTQPLGGSLLQGDFSGAEWCSVTSPFEDSDGDGSPNLEEALRGTDMFRPASRPPVLSQHLASGPPHQWQIVYADPDPAHAGRSYQIACSLTAAQGFAVGLGGICPFVPIDMDALFHWSLVPSAEFANFGGLLDSQGGATATLSFPSWVPPGIPIHLAGVTFDPQIGVILATTERLTALTP